MRSVSTAMAAAAFLAASVPPMVRAAEPQPVAAFKKWSVFVKEEGGERICYAATDAQELSPASVNHGSVFFLVASWKSGAARNQPSLMTGYQINAAPPPAIRIDSEKWEMYADDNEAFIEKASDEGRLIAGMKRGAEMRVSAVSSRGTATSYVFSLSGVSAALARVEEACR